MGNCCGCVTIGESTVGVVEYLGAYDRVLRPGFSCIHCCFESVKHQLSLKLTTTDFTVETITKESLSVEIKVSLQYKINDDNINYEPKYIPGNNEIALDDFSEKSVLIGNKKFPSYQNANIVAPSYENNNNVYKAAYLTKNIISQMEQVIRSYFRANSRNYTMDELFVTKNKLSDDLNNLLNAEVMQYGFIVVKVFIDDIDPPKNVKATMNLVKEAENKREAIITLAKAEREANILKAEAEREAGILNAEAKNKTIILTAEAEKTAAILKAQGLAETRKFEGEGLSAQRQALFEGLKTTMEKYGVDTKMGQQELTNTIITMQYLDVLNTAAHNGKNTFVMRCDPSAVTSIGDQLENALMTSKSV